MKISITIPIHNEQENIKILYNDLVNVLENIGKDFEIIFINDGSDDESGDLLNSLAKSDRRVKIIHFLRNYGQTNAMMAGF